MIWNPPLPPTLKEQDLDREVVDLMEEVEVMAEEEVAWGGAADGQVPGGSVDVFSPPEPSLLEQAQLNALGVPLDETLLDDWNLFG